MELKRIVRGMIFPFFFALLVFPPLVLAGLKISGKVMGANNRPLKLAHVHLARISSQTVPTNPLKSVTVGKNGNFSISNLEPGLYRLFFTGVDHMNFSVPLILDKKSHDVEIRVKMALLMLSRFHLAVELFMV